MLEAKQIYDEFLILLNKFFTLYHLENYQMSGTSISIPCNNDVICVAMHLI